MKWLVLGVKESTQELNSSQILSKLVGFLNDKSVNKMIIEIEIK